MAFDSLSEKLQNVFKNLRSKGRLTEDDVKTALKEVKMALLEADVNFRVVKKFVKDVQERSWWMRHITSWIAAGRCTVPICTKKTCLQ